jgi:cobalt-zinc-cadmium efflux system membrane fusion protein
MRDLAIAAVILLSLSGLQCKRTGTQVPGEASPGVAENAAPPETESSAATGVVRLADNVQELVGIEVEEVKHRECKSVLKAMGKVLAPQQQMAIVSYAFPARVADVQVQIGDWVENGQSLLVLESQEVGEAKSEFYKATAQCELARLNFEREKQLSESGIGIKKNLVAAEAEYKVAQTNAEAAEKRLHVLGFTEEQVKEIANTHQINPTITLYAPIAGKVVESKAVRGAMVDESTEILKLVDPRSLWVDAEVYEKDIAKVRIGQEVEITVPAYPGVTFQGKIGYVGDLVDDQTRTITVRTEVANEDQRLKPGMFADVGILLNGECQTLVVPVAAILEEGNEQVVFVRENDHFVRREIQTGAIDGAYRQIVAGLEAGEMVVTEGNYELKSKLQEHVLKAADLH